MHKLKLRNPLVFFDLETTGLDITKDRIVEFSFVKALINGEIQILSKKVNPERPIPLVSSLIHGIYDEDIKNCQTFKELAKELDAFLEGCDLAGFNMLKFDLPVLVEEFLRAEVNFDASKKKLVDAQRIFHIMEPRNLSAAYKFYCNETLENAHSAEADALATYHILNAQVEKYENVSIANQKGEMHTPIQNDMNALHELTAQKMIDFAQRLAYNEKGEEIINFGKYKGMLIVDVFKRDKTYYDWIMQGDFALDTKRKLTEIRLKNAFK
jgi:DNA polymerase III subunit epsilon